MQIRQVATIALVILLGAGAALSLLSRDRSTSEPEGARNGEEDDHEPQKDRARGPHGGRWFEADAFALEVTIFEVGVPPEFRLYLYLNGKPLRPAEAEVALELRRLGQAPQIIHFSPEADYLRGDMEVVEPHSFAVTVLVHHREGQFQFNYTQEEARIRMSDAEMARAGIGLESAAPARIEQTLILPGEIRLNGDRLAHVVSPVDGVAVSVHANAGEKVSRGDLLAVISSQSLAQMRHAVTRADAKVTLARKTFQREARLWREGISPEQDYRRAEHALKAAEIDVASAHAQLRALGELPIHGQSGQFSLRASIDGTVIDKHLAVGESVSPETRVYTIADLSSVWAEAKVGARELANLRTGQKARVSAVAPDLATEGEVSYLSALLGEQDRAVTARVVLDNAREGWRPGLPVTIEIVTGVKEVPAAISLVALQRLRDWQVVFVRYGEYFEARPLDLGVRDDHRVEVIAGLRTGDQYAATNSYLIKADIGKAGASHDH